MLPSPAWAGLKASIQVSWHDAKKYVAWLSRMTGKPYRLLTDAEYEYAARGGTQTAFPWGDEIDKNHAVCSDCDSKWDNQTIGTAPVGKFAPNGFGLYDMVGNVFTWVEDCYHDNYNGAPTDGSPWLTDDCRTRVVRGGSWGLPAEFIRSAYRHRTTFPDDHDYHVGFRVARTFTP